MLNKRSMWRCILCYCFLSLLVFSRGSSQACSARSGKLLYNDHLDSTSVMLNLQIIWLERIQYRCQGNKWVCCSIVGIFQLSGLISAHFNLYLYLQTYVEIKRKTYTGIRRLDTQYTYNNYLLTVLMSS